MSKRPGPPRSVPAAARAGAKQQHDVGVRPPFLRRLARGVRRFLLVVLLAVIVIALGTTAIVGGAREDAEQPTPGVEEHADALATGAAHLGSALPEGVAEALKRQADLLGPPQRVEPLFDWLPEGERPEPSIAPATTINELTLQLENAAVTTLHQALTAAVDPEAEDASDPGTVSPERLRTLVAVGLEQVEALEALDATRADALRARLAQGSPDAAALATASAPDAATGGSTAPSAAAAEEASDAEVTEQLCAPVADAAEASYASAYLYEYSAVRGQVARDGNGLNPGAAAAKDQEAGVPATPGYAAQTGGEGLTAPSATSPSTEPEQWWPISERRAALGDHLAELLPQECVAVREPAYPVPADADLDAARAEDELSLALHLRDATAAVSASQRPWLLAETLAAVSRAADGPLLTLTR